MAILSLLYLHEAHKMMSLMKNNLHKDYEDLGYVCFGKIVSNVVKICVIFINFGACTR
jgi:hypothetical protein